jgi:hypothetical protein
MICNVCFENHRALGNHIKKHGMTAKEYKLKFNLPAKKALYDDDWIQKMKDIGNEQKESVKGRAHLDKLIKAGKDFTAKIKSGEIPFQQSKRSEWSKCSIEKVRFNSKLLARDEQLINVVLKEWECGVPIKELSISDATAYKWISEGILSKRKRRIYHNKKITAEQLKEHKV